MIICHKYRYIFIKTAKTAGTSVEIALSRYCGPDDIVSPLWKKDEKMRQAMGGRGPQHHEAPFHEYGPKDLYKFLLRGEKKLKYKNHTSAEKIKKLVGENIWNDYFKFCFERNPWDRFVSFYYWRCRWGPRPTIAEFIETEAPLALKKKGYGLYTIDGEVAVDRICRFENLPEELESVRKKVGLPEELVLPRAKSQFRKKNESYRDVLDDEQREYVSRLFQDEIELFGYEF